MADRLVDDRTLPIFIHSSIDDMTDLSPNAMRVYMHLARRASKTGQAWPSYQSIGDHCFTCVFDNPVTRRSTARKAIDELLAAGLITKTNRNDETGNTSNVYKLVNPVPIGTAMPHKPPPVPIGTPPVPIGTKDSPVSEGTPIEGTPLVSSHPAKASPQQEMFGAVCEAIGTDPNTLTKEDKGQIAQAVGILTKANYTVDDIRRFITEHWYRDWRWEKNGKPPTLKILRNEIGIVRSVMANMAPPVRSTNNGVNAIMDYMEMKGMRK
jgi:hypothetical protein